METPIEKFICDTIELIKKNDHNLSYLSDINLFMNQKDFVNRLRELIYNNISQ